jgi:hypothetical protein
VPDRARSPLLFNVFLDLSQRVDRNRPSVAFAVDLCVRVPDYEVAKFLFLKNHFEGGYLFRDMLTIEATPLDLEKGEWRIDYHFAGERGEKPRHAKVLSNTDTEFAFEIPIVQPKPPGIQARLRVVTTYWNQWFRSH